jgi:hypothetical protein
MNNINIDGEVRKEKKEAPLVIETKDTAEEPNSGSESPDSLDSSVL